jgi:integrase
MQASADRSSSGPCDRDSHDTTHPISHRATRAAGIEGLRFHDLRHTANTLAAPGSSTKELMRRMGHASTRAAIMYQHATDERDRAIADALGVAIDRVNGDQGDEDDGSSGVLAPA